MDPSLTYKGVGVLKSNGPTIPVLLPYLGMLLVPGGVISALLSGSGHLLSPTAFERPEQPL